MTTSISAVNQLNGLLQSATNRTAAASDAPASGTANFQSMLLDLVERTNAADGTAQQAIGEYQIGGNMTKPEVFVEMRKAELALRLTMQIRNKLVDVLDEIQQMRM